MDSMENCCSSAADYKKSNQAVRRVSNSDSDSDSDPDIKPAFKAVTFKESVAVRPFRNKHEMLPSEIKGLFYSPEDIELFKSEVKQIILRVINLARSNYIEENPGIPFKNYVAAIFAADSELRVLEKYGLQDRARNRATVMSTAMQHRRDLDKTSLSPTAKEESMAEVYIALCHSASMGALETGRLDFLEAYDQDTAPVKTNEDLMQEYDDEIAEDISSIMAESKRDGAHESISNPIKKCRRLNLQD